MESTNLKISVVTVCYNAVNTIEETMLSVLNQTYPNVEYIIIDGGSTDGTVDIIKKYADRLAYWVSEPDKGIYDAMNKGIAVATGDYINFMNAGDTFLDKRVISDIFPRYNLADYIVGIAKYKNTYSQKSRYWYPIYKNFWFSEVKNGGAVNHQASFIKKELFESGYDIRYSIIADELFFIDKVVFNHVKYQPICRVVALYDGNGISNQKESQEEIVRQRNEFYSRKNLTKIPKEFRDNFYRTLIGNKRLLAVRVFRKIFGNSTRIN